ncbi:serine protease gd [Diabrotica virgifera virgifera]|uniref:Serine protease gd-like n=1 Tax=Diabrotica virgifera virgifera TaxID=50390 RepID=A0A6P7EYV4_DIAVI|nr:serine protease gd [Diabrotica virgifera virgifera]
MKHKYGLVVLLICLPVILSIRVPPNPCPNMFQYYKDPQGRIYGEAQIPYDNAELLVFSVNASFLGSFTQPKLRLERLTELNELNDGTSHVIYNIFFPFTNVIPKITGLTYNDRIYCSGPAEPVIPGEPGITNVWSQISFQFSRREKGFYKKETKPDSSDDDIPVKRPNEKATPPRPKPTPSIYIPTQPEIPVRQPDSWVTPTLDQRPPGPNPTDADPGLIDQKLIDNLFTTLPFTSPSPPATFTSPSFNSDFKCGVASNEQKKNELVPFILGATDTEIGQYPWLVAFFWKRGSKYDYKCSATLISDKHVLTAARCVQYYKVQVVKTEEIFLVMGTNNLDNWNSNGAVTRKARRVDVHPSFMQNSKSAHGDIAIISVDRPVQFSNVLSPVCLWKTDNTDLYPLVNKMGVIAGFGQDENSPQEGLKHVLRAKRADMPIVAQSECLTSPLGFQDVTSDRTFCTKSGETLTGPCTGDTGAGFFISMDGAYYLRGIASAIPDKDGVCDLSNRYSVFCDVAKFLDWIRDHLT